MANSETRATALLFSFSAAAFVLLARRDAIADLLLPALDRFLDGRSLLDLATKRNMILLCHAILLVILRDAGILGAPARRRAATTGAATAFTSSSLVVTAASDAEGACSAPPQPRATSVVVWRRPRNSAKNEEVDESRRRRRLVKRRQPRQQQPTAAAIACAAPTLTLAAEQQPALVSKEIVLVEKAAASATEGKKSDFDRRIVVAKDDEMDANAAAGEVVELADDRRIEEFIAKQRSMMRQESLQLRGVPTSCDTSMLAQKKINVI